MTHLSISILGVYGWASYLLWQVLATGKVQSAAGLSNHLQQLGEASFCNRAKVNCSNDSRTWVRMHICILFFPLWSSSCRLRTQQGACVKPRTIGSSSLRQVLCDSYWTDMPSMLLWPAISGSGCKSGIHPVIAERLGGVMGGLLLKSEIAPEWGVFFLPFLERLYTL